MILSRSKKTNITQYSPGLIFQFNPSGIIVVDFLQIAFVSGHKQAPLWSTGNEGHLTTWLQINQQITIACVMSTE